MSSPEPGVSGPSVTRYVAVGLAAGFLALVLVTAVLARLGWATLPLARPEGTAWFWQVSRAAGVSAYLALTLSVLWGLLVSTGVADGWIARARSVEVHKWISGVGLALTIAHAVVLLGDAFIAFDALDLLVPFLAPYRPVAVGLGVVALYAWVAVYGSFWLRKQLGQRRWRLLHYLSFPLFALGTAHGILAGSDGAAPAMRAMYLAATGLVLWLTCYRILVAATARRPVQAPATTPADPRG